MGGVVAVHIALERPELITHLILTVTCGGVNLAALGAEDWRAEFETHNPNLPRGLRTIKPICQPACTNCRCRYCCCGDAGPISPVRVGQQLIPNARLQVFPEADHDLGYTHAAAVSRMLDEHLSQTGHTLDQSEGGLWT